MCFLVAYLIAAATATPPATPSVDARKHGARCDGSADDSGALVAAARAAAQNGATLEVTCKVRVASGSPSLGVPIRFKAGGGFELAGGALTITGPFVAENSQIFHTPGGKLKITSPGIALVPHWFGAVADGRHDDRQAFQDTTSALPENGGTINLPAGRYRFSCSEATVEAPKIGFNITKPNVRILGRGATIFIDDFTRASANAIEDRRGADVCTVIAFQKTRGGRVEGMRFEGQGDGVALINLRSRAKGIGITDSKDINVTGVSGYGVVGNVVNARGTASVASTENVVVTDSYAERCNENGFNYMGGTSHMVLANTVSRDNGFHGAEFGSHYVTVNNCVFTGNKTGVSQVGQYGTFTNNILSNNRLEGFNFQWNDSQAYDGSHNKLSHNMIVGNGAVGVGGSANTHDNEISDNVILNNGDEKKQGEGVKLAAGCHDYAIYRNWIGNGPPGTAYTSFGIDVVAASLVKISGNDFVDLGKSAVVGQGSFGDVQVASNRSNSRYSVAAVNGSKVSDSDAPPTGSDAHVKSAMHPPACDSTTVGKLWTPQLPVGTRQGVDVCAKGQDDSYHWQRLY